MSEWLGTWRIEEEDIKRPYPSMVKHFPMLTRYYTDSQKMRVIATLSYEQAQEFVKTIEQKYGNFEAGNVKKAANEAINMWIEKYSGG